MAIQENRPLNGRLALITGCSRRIGIGFAIADRLASLGANLLVHAFRPYDDEMAWGADPGGLGPLVVELRRHGTRVESIEADLSDPGAPNRVVGIASTLGHLNILVANHTYSTMGALGTLTAGGDRPPPHYQRPSNHATGAGVRGAA